MTKPTYLPEWASDPSAVRTRPNINRREFGYSVGDKPSSDNWNWQLNNIYKWIEHFDTAGILPYYTATSQIEALDGADLSNNSFYLVKDKGVYKYDNSLSYITDDTYILTPADNIGRFLLILAHPTVQDKRSDDTLGGLKSLYTDLLSSGAVGITNFKYPASINYIIGNRLIWAGNIVTTSTLGGEFWGGSVNVTAPTQTTTNTHLVGLRGWGVDETGKQIATGSRFTIQCTENMSTVGTGTRFAWFVNANGSVSGSATGLLLEQSRVLTTYATINPAITNNSDIGTPSLVYSNIYLQNAPTVLSDIRLKKDVTPIDINFSYGLFDKLAEKSAFIKFKFKDTEYQEEIYKTVVNEEGMEEQVVDHVVTKEVKGNRYHLSFSAQDIVESLLELGHTTADCSLVSFENYKEGDEERMYDPKEEGGAGSMNVALPEFVPLLVQTIADLNRRVKELEEQLNGGN